jgi:ATP-dependent DNA ligase
MDRAGKIVIRQPQLPLIERKRQLRALIRSGECERIIYAQHIETQGRQFFEEICARDLEGIVAKRKMGIYKDDGNSWVKIKNRTYSQAEGRHELMTRKKNLFAEPYPTKP